MQDGSQGDQGGSGTAPSGGTHTQTPPQAETPIQPQEYQDHHRVAVHQHPHHRHSTLEQERHLDLRNLKETKTGFRMWV